MSYWQFLVDKVFEEEKQKNKNKDFTSEGEHNELCNKEGTVHWWTW